MSSKLHTLSNDPYLYYIDNFLTDKECDFMIKHSKEHLKSAGVSFLDKEADKYKKGEYKGRTNSSYWMEHDKYPESSKICEKIAAHLKCDSYLFESFQVIQYNPNEHYDYHYDAYDIHETEKYKKYCGQRGNRIKTVLVYLNDVEEGGGTGFDSIPAYSETIEVKPKKGRMVVFYNLNDDGTINKGSRHAGLPIIKGEKWAFNLWLRER